MASAKVRWRQQLHRESLSSFSFKSECKLFVETSFPSCDNFCVLVLNGHKSAATRLTDCPQQDEVDKLDAQIAGTKKHPRILLPTYSGVIQDKLDSLLSKRLEERIRQLQIFRTQI
jgi:hypothetical protein